MILALIGAEALADDGNYIGPGLSISGETKYKQGFTHFDYTDPDAPKGGEVHLATAGTSFDNLNPFILKGDKAVGIGFTFDTLTVRSEDEPDASYGLVAETIETPVDRSWVIFTLRPEARFSDGTPITPDDVVWTFDTLRTKGNPLYAQYYRSVVKSEAIGERKVKFTFEPGDNRELPSIVGEIPVLSKKYYETHDFEKTTLEPPLGSGPYKVAQVDPGRSIAYERNKDYWAKDLPVNKGRYNYDRIRFDYYRDQNIWFEAFKSGAYDVRRENSSKNWATGYDFPAMKDGRAKKEAIKNELPQGMQAFIFNIRHDLFKDARVRQAIDYAFDFEWSNKTLFYGLYKRTESYFSNSELASSGLPSADELKILEPLKDQIPPEVFTTEYREPKTDGSGNIRPNLEIAFKLLASAGWSVKGGKMVSAEGKPLSFEILLDDPTYERVALPFVQNLTRLGIDARIRTVDTAQYKERLDHFDYDMVMMVFGQSPSPGNEQRDFWGSAAADTPGSGNLIGIKDKAIDKLIELVISAPNRQALITRVHALDRVLLWHHYVVPNYHNDAFWVAYWDKFGKPKIAPKYALGYADTWWIDPAKEAALKKN
jgi:microcin C transport system substrate-binding protein